MPTAKNKDSMVEAMFKVGAHFGLAKARRHPSTKPYVFGMKNKIEIFDLEKTHEALEKAKAFVASVAASGKQALFVSGKSEAIPAVRSAALKAGQPMVAGRWIGGTLTNFGQIRKRIEKFESRLKEKEKGDLAKYTKKERLLIDREIAKLETLFGGIVSMKDKPGVLIVVDPKKEAIAVEEARQTGVPVVAIASTDCDITLVNYAIPANDASAASAAFFLDELARAYSEAKVLKPQTATK
ncbi:MAG TPA: 30S ribosomal protein S2 [Candidatus Paceibacterota bacterium]|nr:30S ribosomal protein S2 [Candidatus Paceibacterota bacterium]